jgi:hypothetical protein
MSKKEYVVSNNKAEAFEDKKLEGQLSREQKEERRKRRGGNLLGSNESKGDRPEFLRAGYQRRWVNDIGGRLDEAYNNDYDFVLKNNEKIKQRAGSKPNGDDLFRYLMEKPIDWHQADQKAKLEAARKVQISKNKASIAQMEKQADVKIYRPDGDNLANEELEN